MLKGAKMLQGDEWNCGVGDNNYVSNIRHIV